MGTPPGQALASPGQVQNLGAALGQTAMPNNPNTPSERLDPQTKTLENLQRIRKALEVATLPYDGMPHDATTDILRMMHGVVSRVMEGIDPMKAFLVGVQAIIPQPMPQGSVPGMPPGMAPPGPGGPMPAPPPSLLQGMQGPVPMQAPGGAPPMGMPPQ